MPAPGDLSQPHLPQQVAIDAYGKGGFRFADMSHRGSLLCLPTGLWAWRVDDFDAVTAADFAAVFDMASRLDILVIGCGGQMKVLPPRIQSRFRQAGIAADTMPTGAAITTYNILLGERRRVAAALIAAP